MLTFAPSHPEYAVILSTFLFAMSTCHVVHTPAVQQVFNSRLKGQVACYSCISYTHDSQRFYDYHPDSLFNITDLYETLKKGGLLIPKYSTNCAETHPANIPHYYGINLAFCPNTDTEAGACVKLKGRYKGDQYVYRNCWSNMWIDERPYARQMSERCYIDELVQNFVATRGNKICFCEDDLCNGNSPAVLHLINALFYVALFVAY